MLDIAYKPGFIRQLQKLPPALQQEVKERIALFRENHTNPTFHTHKLKGALEGRWSFSINYQYRIVFGFEMKKSVVLLAVGDHDVYR